MAPIWTLLNQPELCMLFKNVSIHTVAHLEAPIRVTSAEISARLAKTLKRVRLRENFLETTAGIQARRFWDGNRPNSEAAALVAENVIKKSGLSKKDIDALINASVTKDCIEPAIATIIHSKLQLSSECVSFDLTNACLGFLSGIQVAACMIESGQLKHVLVVAAENTYSMVESTLQRLEKNDATELDVREQLATLTLGSGAVAMIISRSNITQQGHPIRSLLALADTQHHGLCRGWSDRMTTDAPKVLEAGLTLAMKACNRMKEVQNWGLSQFDEFAIHQVSKSLTNAFLKVSGIDATKVLRTYPEFGNMGSVSLPFTISKLEETDRLVAGKRLLMIGVGSGVNSMVIDVQW